MPLSANLFLLESSILTRAKRAISRNNEAGNSLNAVEREPVPTRVLNPTESKESYKLKQRSYGKTKLKKNWGHHSKGRISWGENSTGGSAVEIILQVIPI